MSKNNCSTDPAETYTYNHLGQVTSVSDVSGTTTKTYDAYGSLATETQSTLGATLTLGYDAFGRETSCTISRDAQMLALFGQSYDAASGRLATALYGNVEFAYNYLAGTNLVASLANAFVTKQISYESSRDLPTEIAYATASGTLLAKRNYTYDTLGH